MTRAISFGIDMPQVDAAARVRKRLVEWKASYGHGAGTELAKAVPGEYGESLSPQWASGIFKGKSKLRLEDLDYVADLLGIPPGDLVRRDGDHYLEVIPSEIRFLQHLRALPDTVRHHWLTFLDYVFGFQEQLLAEHKATVDRRTKAARNAKARAERKAERRKASR